MSRVRRALRSAIVGVAAVALFAACGQGHAAAGPTTSPRPIEHAVTTPSESTRMVCAPEAQNDLGATLGVKTVEPPSPTWVAHTYSCDYVYSEGSFTLSVRQLSDATQTRSYFASVGARLTRRMTLTGLGQGAFTTANGSVGVQKDDKVLLVDISRLPARFGVPPDSRANVAISIAATIMGCWTGA